MKAKREIKSPKEDQVPAWSHSKIVYGFLEEPMDRKHWMIYGNLILKVVNGKKFNVVHHLKYK